MREDNKTSQEEKERSTTDTCSRVKEPMEDTSKNVSLICKMFSGDGKAMLFYAIRHRRFKLSKIRTFNGRVREAVCFLEKEKDAFKEYMENEFPQYTTKSNGYPCKLESFMQGLNNSLESIKKIVGEFSITKHRTLATCSGHGLVQKPASEMPMLAYGAYQHEIFGEACWPEEVKTLIDNIVKMCSLVSEMEKMAHEAIEEEKAVRADADLVMALFKEFRSKFLEEIGDMLDLLKNIPLQNILNGNDFYKAIEKAPTFVAALQDKYHNILPKTVKYYFLGEILKEEKLSDITDEEQRAWAADRETIFKMRIIIANFDKLMPEGTKDKEFAKYIYMLCEWGCSNNTKTGIKNVYDCFKSRYSGTHKLRQYNTVNGHRKNFDRKSAMYMQFTKAIDALLNQPENKKLWSQDKG